MTRFARAKGSKASNERLPESATPWNEMKQQLDIKKKDIEDNQKRKEMETVRRSNYKKFLEETEEKKDIAWADFPANSLIIDKKKVKPNIQKKIKSKKINEDTNLEDADMLATFNNLVSKIDQKLENGESGSDFEESGSNSDTFGNEENCKIDDNGLLYNGENKFSDDENIVIKNSNRHVKGASDIVKSSESKKVKKIKKGKKLKKVAVTEENEFKDINEVCNVEEVRVVETEVEQEVKPVKTKKVKKTIEKSPVAEELKMNDGLGEIGAESKKAIKEKSKNSTSMKTVNNPTEITNAISDPSEIEKKQLKNKARNFRKKIKRKKQKENRFLENEANSKSQQNDSGDAKVIPQTEEKKISKNANNKQNGEAIIKPKITENAPKKEKINKDKNSASAAPIKKSLEEMSELELKKFNKKKEQKIRQLEQRKAAKAAARLAAETAGEADTSVNDTSTSLKPYTNNANNNKRQLPKPRDNQEHKKRKPNAPVEQIFVNGKQIELVYFDGFPIRKEDAERLQALRKQMISKGLPRSEVKIAMKLERRKAEKSLTREKKHVCFNCRKSGHNLSECPNLNDSGNVDTAASGICFKCGSTEHTHYQCKVVKNQEFKFASCFICKEQGHISRQCPDNARGLYPKGGACKLCGDVTHLKKDCPKHLADQEAGDISLDVIGNGNIEALENEKQTLKSKNKIVNKVVKF